MYLNSTNKLISIWKKYVERGGQQRFGQWFINSYIEGVLVNVYVSDRLFFSDNLTECALIIDAWLKDNHYFDELPPVINEF